MNTLEGEIESIKTHGSLSLVKIKVDTIFFSTIVIETPDTATYLKLGNNVNVLFKETEVIIGKGLEHAVSMQNKIVGKIIEIKEGEILSKLTIDSTVGKITAIITANAVLQLELKIGETVTAMVKTTEVMLSE